MVAALVVAGLLCVVAGVCVCLGCAAGAWGCVAICGAAAVAVVVAVAAGVWVRMTGVCGCCGTLVAVSGIN